VVVLAVDDARAVAVGEREVEVGPRRERLAADAVVGEQQCRVDRVVAHYLHAEW
jgi:hypothetical protein